MDHVHWPSDEYSNGYDHFEDFNSSVEGVIYDINADSSNTFENPGDSGKTHGTDWWRY